ncbi:MAG: hypothetical protein EPO36_11435 [Chloroflexota bacterium]|nr:MAG: hypothetical protein EPO36_11435 [Chloroflexota bacterium]
MSRIHWVMVAAVVGVLALAAILQLRFRPLLSLPEGAVAIPTRDAVSESTLCTLEAAVDPVRGLLRGDKTQEAWPVWLSRPGGEIAYVRWPYRWSARFEPELQLLDAEGRAVAGTMDEITLAQVSLSHAPGTQGDPYLAHGLFLGGCYP